MSDCVLRVTDLTKRYGDLLAVDRLSLEVRRGEILGFLGPNGAGKTTTLKMMCGLLRPDAGRIEINDRPLLAGETRLLSAVGVSPQNIVVWEMLTCLEQLAKASVGQIVWYVDGAPFETVSYPFVARWPLSPGEHTFEARVASRPGASEEVRVRVE
jgi:ABC-type branched-subunit amino acid transport system ATPase component